MEEDETPPHPLSQFVPTSEPTDEEKARWAEFDAILKNNRVGGSLRDTAFERPTVHFSGEMSGDPWAAGWGMFAHDPFFDAWKAAINDYRNARDTDNDAAFPADLSASNSGKHTEIMGGDIG